jgi:hypothetical protein
MKLIRELTLKGNRKFVVAMCGMSHCILVWTASFVCGIKWPEVFGNIISLSTPVVAFIGTITMALIAGQSAVDYKQNPPSP